MTYSEKLKHPKWQKKRLEVFQRDNFKCILCNDSESTLHVHHKEYISGLEPWEYTLDNFQSLCEYCHFVTEQNKDIVIISKVIKASHKDIPGLFTMLCFHNNKLFSILTIKKYDGEMITFPDTPVWYHKGWLEPINEYFNTIPIKDKPSKTNKSNAKQDS